MLVPPSQPDPGVTASPDAAGVVIAAAARAWIDVRRRAPRVQALTNTVAQALTANVLLAAGARVSLATHRDEVIDMTLSADAVLLNLGTLDHARVDAISTLADRLRGVGMPVVLDPVFVERAPLRSELAKAVIGKLGCLIVKGNAAEMAHLRAALDGASATCVTTGAVDTVERPERMSLSIANGDPLMAEVTAVGCATGALMAALAAITPDAPTAAAAALIGGGIAGEIAARQARGPGDFAVRWIDAVARLDAATILAHARVTTRRQET